MRMQIPFNKPNTAGDYEHYLREAMLGGRHAGDGPFTRSCGAWIEANFASLKTLMTPSCTHALEMSALLCDIKEGDEVIMPSYTFVSTANAFVLRGARIVFVDVRPDTMNIDERLIERAITSRTKAIVPVHYGGVACEMDAIMAIADRHGLLVVEDAAQGVMASYKGRALGTIGHLGCYSFHETKNYSCGEGGALLINDPRFIARAEMIREKGTNRSRFLRGEIDKYTWVDIGSSYLPSEFSMAILYGQLEKAREIDADRNRSWSYYYALLQPLARTGRIELPVVPEGCIHNAHMMYIKVKDLDTRTRLHAFMKAHGVNCASHYVPLHSSPVGREAGAMHGPDRHTTTDSLRLLRLPLFHGLTKEEIAYTAGLLRTFFVTEETNGALRIEQSKIG